MAADRYWHCHSTEASTNAIGQLGRIHMPKCRKEGRQETMVHLKFSPSLIRRQEHNDPSSVWTIQNAVDFSNHGNLKVPCSTPRLPCICKGRPRRHNRASSQATPPTSLRAFKPPQALTKLQPSSKEQGKSHTAQLRGVPPLASACPESPSLDQLRCLPAMATAGPAKTSPMAWPRLSREIMSRQGNFPIIAK